MMRAKKRLQRQISLNKVLFASGFLFLLFLLFFVVFSLLFFLFVFWRSVFLLRVFSQVWPFFWWLAYFDSIQFVAFFVCAPYLGLLCFLFACLLRCLAPSPSLSLSLFLTPNYTYSPRRVCPVYLYWTFPELQLPKKKPQVCGWRCGWGKRERGGRRGCVCRPFNVMKETHTHTGEHMT